jgi:UPF0755 protein
MRKSSLSLFIPIVLILLLLAIGLAIFWLGVPTLAEGSFGSAASSLTPMQRWTYSLQVLVNENKLTMPKSLVASQTIFTIPSGASVTSVAMALEQNGYISSWEAFRYYVIYKGMDTQIKAGDFKLSPSMTAIEISESIQSAYSADVPFYIYPGWRAEEIAAALPSSGIEVTPEEFMALIKNPVSLDLPGNLHGLLSLEGCLFPGEYVINRKISAENLVMTFVQRFEDSVSAEVQAQLQDNGLSLRQSMVLASIIQRETFVDSERALMASVFYNRLATGMKLETDPTVQYALGYSDSWGGWWKSPLAISDLSVQSPFNTYIIPALPDHPIANPDLPSIMAVAQPESSFYYYFRANCDGSGSHVFSQTFEEHLSNACQ